MSGLMQPYRWYPQPVENPFNPWQFILSCCFDAHGRWRDDWKESFDYAWDVIDEIEERVGLVSFDRGAEQ